MNIMDDKISANEDQIVMTVCRNNCGSMCPLKVHVKNGQITAIEPDGEFRACAKARAYRQMIYSPDRILYPMKRTGERGKGEFKRISWNEALDEVAMKINRVRQSYGPSALLHIGNLGDEGFIQYGRFLIESILARTGGYSSFWGISTTASSYGVGATYGKISVNTRNNLIYSNLIIMWGWNPAITNRRGNAALYLAKARESGSKIVCVDPRYTNSAASFAQQWIPIRPGTDTAMLLAMAFVIIKEKLQDQDFIDKYTVGFNQFKKYVLGKSDGIPKTPRWAEDITGVSASTIINLAREYATNKPAALMDGAGPARTNYGEQYWRATATLATITGNVGIQGGSAAGCIASGMTPSPLQYWKPAYQQVKNLGGKIIKEAIPFFGGEPLTQVNKNLLADAILKGKNGGYPADYKMMFITCNDYVNQQSNINKIIQALNTLEFIVVCEQVMNTTAKFADILLPVNTFLERNDLVAADSALFYGSRVKAIDSIGESKSYFEIASELSSRLGLSHFTDKTEDEWLREQVKQCRDIPSYDEFRNQGAYKIKLDRPVIAFENEINDPENNPFPTPSGKIEIYSQRIADIQDPLIPPIPSYIQSFSNYNELINQKYPLQLITPHSLRRSSSQFEKVAWLNELYPQTVVINSVDAQSRNIREGDMVKVFNDRGTTIIPAEITERIMIGVVQIENGGWFTPDGNGNDHGGAPNVLTEDTISPTGSWPVNSTLVQVEKM